MKWVHRHCLDRWRADASNPRNFTHCRHCDCAFQMVLRRPPTTDEAQLRERRRRFVRRTVSHFALAAIALQFALCFLAMLIRAIDQKESLVKTFDLRQIEGTPAAGMGDYWNAVLHHKSTYYLAAVLLTLFFVGVGGMISSCKRSCSTLGVQCGSTDCCPCAPNNPMDNYFLFQGMDGACQGCCECTRDCGYFCCEGAECPGCECPATCPECACPDTEGSSDMGGCMALCLGVLVVAIIAFVIAGLFFAFMAAVVWMQKVVARYMQLSQLRTLTGEYIVKDLSEARSAGDVLQKPPSQQDIVGLSHDMPSAPYPHQLFSSTSEMEPTVIQSLSMDLQAVYGRCVVNPV